MRKLKVDSSRCKGCLRCEMRCSIRFGNDFSPSRAYIEVLRVVGREEEFVIRVKEGCDACGLCARECPYGAIALEGE